MGSACNYLRVKFTDLVFTRIYCACSFTGTRVFKLEEETVVFHTRICVYSCMNNKLVYE